MNKALEEWSGKHAAEMEVEGFYASKNIQFRTLAEANQIAQQLAKLTPNPALAAMGLTEILLNAVEHGNLGIDYNEKANFENPEKWLEEVNRRLTLKENIRKYVSVDIESCIQQIKFTVTDCGYGFDWEKYQDVQKIPRMNKNGRGILIASQMGFDKLNFIDPGNKVECICYRPSVYVPQIRAHHFG